MSNLKKNILYFTLFLSFLLLGLLVSRVQANNAELTLATNGLSTSAKEITTLNKVPIKQLLAYVDQNYAKEKVQIQLTNKTENSQILVWSNFDLTKLPIEKGRFLTKSDFDGIIPFALYTKYSSADVEEIQGNPYILYDNRYISVVGSLREGYQKDNYYITTGLHQTTNKNFLNDYTLVIDGLSQKQYSSIAHHIGGKVKQPRFIQKIMQDRQQPVYLFALAVFSILVGLVVATLLGIGTRRANKNTELRDSLFQSLQTNIVIRFGGFTLVLAGLALIISHYFFYFSQISQYVWLLVILLVILNINFSMIVLPKSTTKKVNKGLDIK
ncbi:hypothetical protein FC62_GL000180 [Amylolactobacillus amylotrophicus DSM 20534]|uniref:Uncharacterized protein n=3 Tax=Amylolactobacillus TaxID=2767876 RepID=A0A1L6XA03_9LACO|nr:MULTISPECIES: hypothetical protein [Amylolactobacillus]APT17808.1 hypothetical protein LA20533_00025 [Amylolactobacillus amylophilus DSM 20533 = JCM 1125]APT19228.1 hypothetical protein LA20533_08210 [Amylolactobacillus amylophilus DSM 20533 = JCM 1125]KRK38494.1 hypothetical protein FC62_GL000180 [Amylolactobacillus amylotrophicus DSM 20534]KRM42863.1 hypothetical protein FD40_GL000659 [Amylolactobacillus amylophilus DSM 20533 = JCM 1125]GED79727.1 hypothetical protein LAM01_02000 [Amylola